MAYCAECEERRRKIALWLEASQEWAGNPTGPSINELYKRKAALNTDSTNSDSTR